MKRFKKALSLFLVFVTVFAAANFAAAAETTQEPAFPQPYFDLTFKDDQAIDLIGNTTTTLKGGTIEECTVVYDGEEFKTTAYRAKNPGEYIEVQLNKITNSTELGSLILGGSTFELLFQIDKLPKNTFGLFTSCNAGGVTLYTRGATAQMNFQIGSSVANLDSPNYTMVQPGDYTKGRRLEAGKIMHIVGTYEKASNMMSLYYNGELVGSVNYGTGTFKAGGCIYNKLGIGRNVSYMTEALANETPFTVMNARVYDKCLSGEQVTKRYNDSISAIVGTKEITFPSYKGGKYEGSFKSANADTYLISGTTSEEYNNYLKFLESRGYKKHSENTIGNNLFALYTNPTTAVNVSYSDFDKNVRITTEAKSVLPRTKVNNTYIETTTSLLIQQKLYNSEVAEGMSYILRLADGSFIIVDGGWPEQNYVQADNLFKLLSEQSTDKISIAAWIFTHAHGDHIGTFNDFIEKYSDRAMIEQLIYNFPADEDIQKSDAKYMLDNHRARLTVFKQNIAKYIPSVTVSTPHSGYKYFIRNAEIEILSTYEDLFPKSITNGETFNSSTTVFNINIKGQKIMFLGDSSVTMSNFIAEKYGNNLKSDFMQLAHHGYGGGTVDLYTKINPTVALWPTAASTFEPFKAYAENAFLINNPATKEIIVSHYGKRVLELPYTPVNIGSDKFTKTPIEEKPLLEPERPNTNVIVPKPYFDLVYKNGTTSDAQNNVAFNQKGGSVDNVTVSYKGTEYTLPGYRATQSGDYIEVLLDKIESESQWKDFIMGGCTFEMFVQLDRAPLKTVGFLTSCNAGGVTLYLRREAAQMNFQVGSTKGPDAGNITYGMAQPSDANLGARIDGGRVAHVIGTYNKETNKLSLYYNGVLVAQADYGTGEFSMGKAIFNKLGIGRNVSYMDEALANETNYTVLRSRIYSQCLTDQEVAAEYYDSIDMLTQTTGGDDSEVTIETSESSDRSTDFSENSSGNPLTGDSHSIFVYISVFVFGLMTAIVIKKRRFTCGRR